MSLFRSVIYDYLHWREIYAALPSRRRFALFTIAAGFVFGII